MSEKQEITCRAPKSISEERGVNKRQLQQVSEAAGKRLLTILESEESIETKEKLDTITVLLNIIVDINYRFSLW